jgi:seryl-tRNA synthetase
MSKLEITEAELQEKIEAAVEAATSGLKTKNTELLGELKKARKAGDITPEQLAEVEAERDKLKGELTKAQKDAKTAAKQAEDATKALQAESGFTANLLIENGLRDALTANKVLNPAHQKAAIALLKTQGAQVVADGDKRIAKIGEKVLADAVKEWASSDEGKHFVSAGGNSGGGAGGGGSGGDKAKSMTRAEHDAMAPGDRAGFFKEGGRLVDA